MLIHRACKAFAGGSFIASLLLRRSMVLTPHTPRTALPSFRGASREQQALRWPAKLTRALLASMTSCYWARKFAVAGRTCTQRRRQAERVIWEGRKLSDVGEELKERLCQVARWLMGSGKEVCVRVCVCVKVKVKLKWRWSEGEGVCLCCFILGRPAAILDR